MPQFHRSILVFLLACFVAAIPACRTADGGRNGPYAPLTEEDRNSERAGRLTREAAALIHSNPGKAEELLRAALTADLYHGPAHNNLGVLYLKQGKLYEAAGEFEWARKLMPGHPDPRMNLALTLERAGRTGDALDAYRTALEVHPDHLPTIQAMTRLQLRSGRKDARTASMLDEIALRAETEEWRNWARLQRGRMGG